MLSIIVPIYNASEYLEQCIESILRQSYKNIELLLVDNNSTDNSFSICKEYANKDSRVRVLEENKRGPFFARKKGVLAAVGEYITFVDADDFIADTSFSIAVEDIKNKIDVICFNIYRYFGENNVRLDSNWKEYYIYNREDMISKMYPQMLWNKNGNSFGVDPTLCCKIVKSFMYKKIFERISGFNFHYGEDVAIIYPLLLTANTVSVHSEAYYYHRQRLNGELPSYIKDSRYLDDLYSLYVHLRHELCCIDNFQEQLDLFYINSVNLAKKKYFISNAKKDFLFPFDKVNKNERIVIYGAGVVGTQYVEQNNQLNYCQIILWVDKYSKKSGVSPTLNLRKLRTLAISSHTRKPKPPIVTKVIRVKQTRGSSLKRTKLCPGAIYPNRSKPALQKAEMAWNTPQPKALWNPNSGKNRRNRIRAPTP